LSSEPPPSISASEAAARARFFIVFPSVALPMCMAVMDQTIVATALPAIAGALGEVERVSWIVIGYLVAATISTPVYGRLGDLIGRRNLMLVALAIVMVASVGCALADSLAWLTAARLAQGLGGGGLMTLSQALIGEAVPPRVRARYQGYMGTVMVTASGLGPVLGGFVTQLFGWHAVFLLNLPLGAVAVLLTLRLPKGSGTGTPFRFDFIGLLIFSIFIGSTLVTLEQLRSFEGDALARGAVLAAVAAVAVVVLIWWEGRASTPLLPLPLLRDSTIWRCTTMAGFHGALMVSLITYLPIYYRVVRGASASELGLLLLPLPAGIGIGSVITGRIMSRTGYTAILPSIGLPIAIALLVGVAFYSPSLSTIGTAVLLGLAMGFSGTVMGMVLLSVQTAAGPAMLGAGAAAVLFARSLGAAFGTAMVGAVLFTVLTTAEPQAAAVFGEMLQQGPAALDVLDAARRAAIQRELVNAFRAAFLSIAAFAMVSAVLAWTVPMRRI
jgi:EmrB/QacA subfamily drug resistance transporter